MSILPLQVVQRIASGEVITGFEAVIQELVENSIDAKATTISVDLDFATNSVTVTDNGSGISLQQGLLSVARCNATSKLHSLDELLHGVSTLGFRGQGLWAIAATATNLSLSSRTHHQLHGTAVSFSRDGEHLEDSIQPVPMAAGTVVTAVGLPWTLSGRELSRALSSCKKWLLQAALCYPFISFRLSRNKKTYWASAVGRHDKNVSRSQSLAQEFKASPSDFRQVSVEVSGLGTVDVVIGIPSMVHSSTKTSIMTAINGRCVQVDEISAAVMRLVTVRKGRFPVLFIHLTVAESELDWNVSPVKSIVRFRTATMVELAAEKVPIIVGDMLCGMPVPETMSEINAIHEHLPISVQGPKVLQKLIASMSATAKGHAQRDCGEGVGFKNELEVPPLKLPRNARVVAQLLQTYLLIEYNGGIILAEQHVADERALFEELVRTWRTSRFTQLRVPVRLPAPISDEALFSLESLDFEVVQDEAVSDPDGHPIHMIRGVPAIMSELPTSVLGQLLLRLCSEASTIEEAAAAVSCKMATKNGTPLSNYKMTTIFSRLMQCQNPYTCPHGRPIFVDLQARDLAQLFGRSWLPERINVSGRISSDRSGGVLPE